MNKVTVFTVLILASLISEAQGVLTINGATTSVPSFYVNNGAHVYVAGGVNILQSGSPVGASGDYLQNNGTIQIVTDGTAGQGDFTNNVSGLKVYTTGQSTGTVIFSDSNETQNITGGGTVEFLNLSVDKSNTKLDLEENITVDGSLDLGGVVNLQGSDLTLPATGTLAGAPYSSSKMIQADSTGQFISGVSTGAGTYLFPVGDGSPAYTPVTVNLASNASAGTIGLNLRAAGEPNINNPSAAQDYIKRYWTFTNTGLTTYTYTGNFNYLHTDIVGTESLMEVSRWANPWYADPNSTAGSNTLTINSALDQVLAPLTGDFTGRNASCATSAGVITAPHDSICAGTAQALAVEGNTAAVQWQSSPTGSNFTSVPGEDSVTYTIQPTQTTYYRAYASGNTCSDTSATFQLVVNALPTPATPTVTTDTICSNDSTQICIAGNYSSYLWNTGATTSCIEANQAQAYWVSVTDKNGCSNSSGQADLSVYPVSSVSIDVQGDTLSSFGAAGYQWIRGDSLIPGANSDYYVATGSGEYSVEITDKNGCLVTSSDVLITLGISNLGGNTGIEIYPNPASGSFNIKYTGPATDHCQVVMLDMLGEKVMQQEVSLSNAQTIPVDVNQLPKGIYLVQLQSEDISVTQKIVVQ